MNYNKSGTNAVGVLFAIAAVVVHAEVSESFVVDICSEPVLLDAEYSGYGAAFHRLAVKDAEADRAWLDVAGTPRMDGRRREVRASAEASFGGYPVRTPLNARTVGTVNAGDYCIDRVVFESRPGFFVTGNVYRPGQPGDLRRRPAILIPCGHSAAGKNAPWYQRAGVEVARAGFVTLVFDPVDQGERVQRPRRSGCGMTHNACGSLSMLLGQSMLRIRLWDAKRALDYLETRPDVDGARLGVMGVSGGGTMTSMLAAFDDRIRCAAPACYISSLRRVVDNCGPQDGEQLIFGQLKYGLNHAGLLLLAHQAPSLVACSQSDFFPIDGVLDTMRTVREVAVRERAPDRYEMVWASGPHDWYPSHRAASIAWMRRWLCGDKTAGLPPNPMRLDVPASYPAFGADFVRPGEVVNVTPTGNVLDLPGSRSVYELIADDLADLERRRPRLTLAQRRSEACRLAGIRPRSETGIDALAVGAPVETNGVRLTRIGFARQDGSTAAAVLFEPLSASGGTPVIFAGTRGRSAFASGIAATLSAGRAALVVDLEGCGEVGVTKRRIHVGSCVDDGLGKIFYLLGESVVGRRAEQLAAVGGYLSVRFGRKPDIVADGMIAIAAAHAVAVEPLLFGHVELRNRPLAWGTAVRKAATEPIQWTVTDSVNGALTVYDWPELIGEKGNGYDKYCD